MRLLDSPTFHVEREHRFLRVHLNVPHRVLSTSSEQGGERTDLRFILNCQSCEGSSHHGRAQELMSMSRVQMHQASCEEAGLEAEFTAMLGTAANMDYAAIAEESYADAKVTAIATAGVEGNAGCAGDPAQWHEGEQGYVPVHATPGTINIILLFHQAISPAALARSVVTMTEGKSAALAELAIPSRYSEKLATGTGTDQYAVATPLAEDPRFHWTGHHAKLGELVGVAIRKAVLEALRWQNGLEVSHTRGLFHALGRFGIREASFRQALGQLGLDDSEEKFLLDSITMISHDIHTSAVAYAMASILDRLRVGALPEYSAWEALRWQAALLACSVGGSPAAIGTVLANLSHEKDLQKLVAQAVALGWKLKWNG